MTTPIVLIPGFSCTGAVFHPAIDALWPLGPVMIAKPVPLDAMSEITSAILADAPPRFALVGFSMGGFIAFEIIRRAPDRVTGLCMISSMARPDNDTERARRQRIIDFTLQKGLTETCARYFPAIDEEDRGRDAEFRALHKAMALEIGQQTYVAHQTAIRDRVDSRPDLEGISVPFSVIVGDRDRVTPPGDGQDMAARVTGARFELIADAGHFALLERADAVNMALRRWVADIERAKAAP